MRLRTNPDNQERRRRMSTPGASPALSGFDLFILVLSWFSLFNLVLVIAIRISEIRNVVLAVEGVICLFLIADVLFRLRRAESKRTFMLHEHGWLDIIGSLPVPGLRLARLPRMRQVGRELRAQGSRKTWRVARSNLASSSLWAVVFLTILVVQFGSMGVLRVERDAPDATISTASDALWWSYATITTVGYGDVYPVTGSGRLIGVAMLTIGVGLFGVLTGYLANAFLTPSRARRRSHNAASQRTNQETAELLRMIDELRTEVVRANARSDAESIDSSAGAPSTASTNESQRG